MDKKPTIFDYLSQVFMIFGITVLLLNIFCLIFGEAAKEISAIFALGSEGLSVKIMLQFLLAIAITIVLRAVFMTDLIIKRMPLSARIIVLFAASLLNIMVFIIVCGWVPVDNLLAWVMFIVSFAISCAASALISILAERTENKRLEEALNKLKEKEHE